jgi:hypothetical protein
MSAYKRTEITVETDRVVTIRRRRSHRVWCRECGREVDAVGADEAATLAGLTQTQLRDRAGANRWHMCEGWDDETLICLESLLNSMS